MNILPHKSWHVRTKKNIARVRRDEAKAAEEEQKRQDRIKLAEREARTELLRQRVRGKDFISFANEDTPATENPPAQPQEHVNFFKDLEDGTAEFKKTNEEHEKEKKEEQEKYEKKIGYLTYLGQDTNEALGKQSWYNTVPDRKSDIKGEVNLKVKSREDPLNIIKKYTSEEKCVNDKDKDLSLKYKSVLEQHKESTTSIFPISLNEKDWKKEMKRSNNEEENNKKKRKRSRSRSSSRERKRHKKNSKHKSKSKKHKHKNKSKKSEREKQSSASEDDDVSEALEKRRKLEQLRAERLKREQDERKRAQELLDKLNGTPKEKVVEKDKEMPIINRKYNSQFNPELAKQNYDTRRR